MKKFLIILLISFAAHTVFAQGNMSASHTAPIMTNAFSDSLKKEISVIIPAGYTIKLSYTSTISPEGKLLKPLILRESADGTVEDNEFVVKLRILLMNAPAWKPAFDSSLSKNISDVVLFDVEIKKGKIKIASKPSEK
jgi:hypothetical protein